MSRLFPLGIDNNGNRLLNVGSPTAATDGVNKQYADNIASGLTLKAPVVAAATGNITLSAPGASLDGVTLTNGDRVLLSLQTNQPDNGIYVFNGAAAALTRSTDANTGASLQGALVTVNKGATLGNQMWYQTADDIVLGTTALVWGKWSPGQTLTAGNGISISGGVVAVNPVAGGGLTVSSSGVSVDPTVVARKTSGLIGNASLTSFTFPHNLGNLYPTVSVHDVTTGREIYPDITAIDSNNLTIAFSTAPSVNGCHVQVIG